jgi:hypothetical protein
MYKMKKEIKPLLDEYLESVNGMQEVETDPFFYTRLSARMQKQQDWVFPLRPAWIITGLALLLVLNGFMALNRFKSSEQNTTTASSSLQSFANAYDLNIQSTY